MVQMQKRLVGYEPKYEHVPVEVNVQQGGYVQGGGMQMMSSGTRTMSPGEYGISCVCAWISESRTVYFCV